MASLETFIARAIYWVRDANMGYSQADRWNFNPQAGNCDCSSLVIYCLREAGFDTGDASYTGNLSANLTARGWQRVPNNGNPQRGDILLNDAEHTAIYIGGRQLAQASQSENNTAFGQAGDQTGYETNISSYYNYPWNCYLRYTGDDTMALNEQDLQQIARYVNSYRYGANSATLWDYVTASYNRMLALQKDIADISRQVWQYSWNDKDGKGKPEGGNMYNEMHAIINRLDAMQKTITDMQTQLAKLQK